MIKALLLIVAICIDGFAAALGIGSAGIKIPFRSSLIISFIGTIFLTCSIAFADLLRAFIPDGVCRIISFVLLLTLGLFNLFQNYFKSLINRKGTQKTNPAALFFDGTAADTDNSKSISPRESFALSIALSADSLITGIGAGLVKVNLPLLGTGVFLTGLLSISAGYHLGRKIVSSFNINLGWLCGTILIVLAFIR